MSRFVDPTKLFTPPPKALDFAYEEELSRFTEAQTSTRVLSKKGVCWPCVVFLLVCLTLLTIGPM